MTRQESGSFNFDDWKSQGEAALDQLVEEEKQTSSKLDKIRNNIKHLKRVLGDNKKEVKNNKHKGKIMNRPILLSFFVENEGKVVSLDDIIDYVQQEKPKAVVSSIKTSLSRLCQANENIELREDGYIYNSN